MALRYRNNRMCLSNRYTQMVVQSLQIFQQNHWRNQAWRPRGEILRRKPKHSNNRSICCLEFTGFSVALQNQVKIGLNFRTSKERPLCIEKSSAHYLYNIIGRQSDENMHACKPRLLSLPSSQEFARFTDFPTPINRYTLGILNDWLASIQCCVLNPCNVGPWHKPM